MDALCLVSTDDDVPGWFSYQHGRIHGDKEYNAYLRVAPDSSRNTASLSPPSFWPEQAPFPRSKRARPPEIQVE
jgi:hypothetical protein